MVKNNESSTTKAQNAQRGNLKFSVLSILVVKNNESSTTKAQNAQRGNLKFSVLSVLVVKK